MLAAAENLSQVQTQQQRLVLSPAMRQSLRILQLPMASLGAYITELAVGNPMLDVEDALPGYAASIDEVKQWEELESGEDDFPGGFRAALRDNPELFPSAINSLSREETFQEYLEQQLELEHRIPERYLPLCRFLVESLNGRGYLDEPVELLALCMEASVEDTTQALYMVQEMSPAGVGARSLRECLILQLARGRHFNGCTLKIINECLPLLAKGSIDRIAAQLGVPRREAEAYCGAVRDLNPIPSRGFSGGGETKFIIPEAEVSLSDGTADVKYNNRAAPRVSLNENYQRLLESGDGEVRAYLKRCRAQAQRLQADLEGREATMTRLVQLAITVQRDYLLGSAPGPAPLTMSEAAEALGVHVSTVSRAIQDKYIIVAGKPVSLRELISVPSIRSGEASRKTVQAAIRRLIRMEDPERPLTDEDISSALAAMDFAVSRRTVAAYRTEMEIPAACRRRAR